MRKITRADTNFPKVVLIDNFSGCNLKCSCCDHVNIKNYRKIGRMPFNLYTKIIDEIAEKAPNTRVWLIFFGDPFLLNDMHLRIKYAKTKGLADVVLNTNGKAITRLKAMKFVAAGLDSLYVGIDAFSHYTYNKIRVGGNLYTTIKNVGVYKEALNICGTKNQKLFVQFVETDINKDEKQEFIDAWSSVGIQVKIRPKVSWAGLVDADNLMEFKDREPCGWVMETMAILNTGKVAMCAVDIHGRGGSVSNVKDKSLQYIWTNELLINRLIHKDKRWENLPFICTGCLDWQSYNSEIK